MLNCIAKLLYQLIPEAFPHNLALGDVFGLIKKLQDVGPDAIDLPRLQSRPRRLLHQY